MLAFLILNFAPSPMFFPSLSSLFFLPPSAVVVSFLNHLFPECIPSPPPPSHLSLGTLAIASYPKNSASHPSAAAAKEPAKAAGGFMFFGIRNNLWKAVRRTRSACPPPPPPVPAALNPIPLPLTGPSASLERIPSTTPYRACAIPAPRSSHPHVSSGSRFVRYTPTFGIVSEPPCTLRSAAGVDPCAVLLPTWTT